MAKKRILSGMRPTGKLHLGNYVGALENWVKLQDEYENYYLVADYHMLTTDLNTDSIKQNTIDMVIDWLATGLDPVKSPFFRQSQVKEHTELFLLLSMLITTARLERNPTLKDQVRDLNIESLVYGHLGYPVLQAADILLYKGQVVPVGEDQIPHVEISREVARRFNQQYGQVFPEPDVLLTKFARLPGLDGVSKMSKSLNNAIYLSDTPEVVTSKMKKAVTDPLKVRKGDPGRPDICVVYMYHQKFNTPEAVAEVETGCRSGALGCVDCKLRAAARINEFLSPVLEKRRHYESNPNEVFDILHDGETRARAVAQSTMQEVHENMKLG
ncbi:MAG: tryptophan--tRNA ligase [Ignavibacteria bacterium]|nr:tryptophan--tRNA ligase [Ignavibacteria bacterium]MCU7501561.1 tryptophan--tRNA ligase [Ignavibacteria bacterium]MCU7517098.1 tryptophan--tRNA ligase [Ignavibacteria bacterium]